MRRVLLLLVACSLVLVLAPAQGQQLYRWVDKQGQMHVSDQPPPPDAAAKVQKQRYGGAESGNGAQAVPYELAKAMKDAPVTLYTSPTCKTPCADARHLLNQRGVPFKEVAVWNPQTNAELKHASGSNEVPVLVVGKQVQKGYSAETFNTALDAAGYPKAGLLPPRSQAAPAAPRGYVPPAQRPAQSTQEHGQAKAPPHPLGPYAPR